MRLLVLLFTFVAISAQANEDIQQCLKGWGKHPFDAKNPTFKTLSSKTKVLGIGGGMVDNDNTKTPQLVLVKPSVAVLSKATVKLLNPNGWYCMKGAVGVLSKSVIEIDCKAHLAIGDSDSVAVLGSRKGEQEVGVTVLGKTQVQRVNCN